jgi:hypothetical protein
MAPRAHLIGWVLISLLSGCSSPEPMTGSTDEVSSRGVSQGQRPPNPGGQSAQIPTFPQKFDVQGPEADSFGFAVTQPGPVIVDIQGQGAPVTVTLQVPGGQPIVQQATGNLRIPYAATPQDIQRGILWGIQVRLAQPRPPQAGGRASGTINVQSPPVNQAVVQQAVQALAAQQKPPSTQEQQQAAAQANAQMDQAFQQRKAQFDQQQTNRRAALHAQIQPQIDQLKSRQGTQVKPRGLEGTETASEVPGTQTEGEIGTRALRSEATLPTPAIAGLSVTQGQPGDPVLINGSNFSTAGEVHFVLNPGKDLIAPVQIWTDRQIFVSVPDISNVLAYNGVVYVVRGTDKAKTNLVPWSFHPSLEIRESRWTLERTLKWPVMEEAAYRPTTIAHGNGNPFVGFKDDDEFFMNTRLKNAWLVDDVRVVCAVPWGSGMCDGNAYEWESRRGTDSPYLKVHWWLPAAFGGYKYTFYNYLVRIVGPKGVPDGVVVP